LQAEPPNNSPITVDDIDSAPDDTDAVQGDTLVSDDDLRGALARVGEEKDALQAELDQTKKRVRTIEILDELIEPYAKRAFIFMCVYCGVVALLLVLHGFTGCPFELPESALKFLVGSTATTVIGLVGMVLTGIFVGARRNHD
tara:strand:+ start:879 stop:1307 length:429 start_codon:yes stop_codon:yes gene_type:complete